MQVFALSLICLVCCLFVVLTFALDTTRFPYPERPIVYLSACYGAMALIFCAAYFHGEDIACNPEVENSTMNFLSERTIRQGALGQDMRCTLSAIVLYFCLMAGSLWWVMLTASWFLSAGLKWGQEAIDAKAGHFHTVVWVLPSVQTLLAVVFKKIEGTV